VTDDVPLADKKRRLIHLQKLQKGIQLEINRSFIGREIKVLCLGTSVKGNGLYAGRTEGHQVVNFSSPQDVVGRFVTVSINEAGPYSLRGEASRPLEI
jgi:tRNA-2-methylthio-N6-dimethylallyladenosine synthase